MHRVHLVDELVDHVDLGVLRGDVAAGARAEPRLAGGHARRGSGCRRAWARTTSRGRRTPSSRPPRAWAGAGGGDAISGAVLRAREEREPVGPGLHEVELEARVAPAVQLERDLLVVPLDRLVPAVVEDPDLAGAVVALGDRALRTSRTRADGPRSARRGACRPSWSAGPSAPPSSGARRRAPGARRSAAASRGACGSRTSCRAASAASPGAGSGVPSKSRCGHVLHEVRILRGGGDLLGGLRPGARRGGPREVRSGGSSSTTTPSASSAFVRSIASVRTPANRSPTRAKRSHTLSMRKSCGSKPPRSTSSHVERRADRAPAARAAAVRGGDVRALPVHVVVDEDLAGAVGDLPRHRDAVGVGAAGSAARTRRRTRAPGRRCIAPRSSGT